LSEFFQTSDYWQLISENVAGNAQPNCNASKLASLPLALPPLAEQKRIVAKVEELLARVNAARERLAKIPALLKRFRQSVLAAACSGLLTEEWREENSAAQSAETTLKSFGLLPITIRRDLDFPKLPEKWTWVDLNTLSDRNEAFCYGVVQPGKDDPSGVFLVRAGDLNEGTVDVSALRRIPKPVDAAYARSRLRGGEILVTVVGAGIGESAIVPSHCAGFNLARAVAKIPIRQFSAEYVLRWLQNQTARSWMDNDAREVARPTLNLEQLRTLPIPLPPRSEQEEIVRRVDALFALADKIEARVKSATARVEKSTQAILAKAFRGELVPTEAELARQEGRDYEPASVLLERIRMERTALECSKPSRRGSKSNASTRQRTQSTPTRRKK
jgi:type I restriction enzyme S subunit